MGDLSEIAKLLISKAEEYGQLLGTKAFPLFVQREILWGHVNQALGWLGVGLAVVAIILFIVGASDNELIDAFIPIGIFMFMGSAFMAVSCFIKAALLLKSPELSAITTILRIIAGGGK